jgi:hypothetical protein
MRRFYFYFKIMCWILKNKCESKIHYNEIFTKYLCIQIGANVIVINFSDYCSVQNVVVLQAISGAEI